MSDRAAPRLAEHEERLRGFMQLHENAEKYAWYILVLYMRNESRVAGQRDI